MPVSSSDVGKFHGIFFAIAVLMAVCVGSGKADLSTDFYASTCPNVESIVKGAVTAKFQQTFVTVSATPRLFFHDCFVEGCDGSVLIASTSDNTAEKDASENLSLAGDGFDTVIKAKQAVEASCPNQVSCADILALAARDVIQLAGGPTYSVELGRRDGLVSKASRVEGNLPLASFDLEKLNSLFSSKGISQTDMVALSGAHTVGFSHCNQFANRIYGFSSSSSIDPSLDPSYATQLQHMCPRDVDPTVAINMDPVTPRRFDNQYYENLQSGQGLFTSDEVLFLDSRSKSTVNDFASSSGSFESAFVTAITNMGRVGVKTGGEGEIRRDCSAFNS